MKMMMLTGAALGFAVGVTFSLLRQSTWPTVVWHACIAAYVAGMMFRWWGRHWTRNLRLALVEKQAAALREVTAQPAPGSPAAAARTGGAVSATSISPSKR
jgi:hypothetical protein